MAAMLEVDRGDFAPETPYGDHPVPIGESQADSELCVHAHVVVFRYVAGILMGSKVWVRGCGCACGCGLVGVLVGVLVGCLWVWLWVWLSRRSHPLRHFPFCACGTGHRATISAPHMVRLLPHPPRQ
jgi:hypothetical protein